MGEMTPIEKLVATRYSAIFYRCSVCDRVVPEWKVLPCDCDSSPCSLHSVTLLEVVTEYGFSLRVLWEKEKEMERKCEGLESPYVNAVQRKRAWRAELVQELLDQS
jgi:hypothetical protein